MMLFCLATVNSRALDTPTPLTDLQRIVVLAIHRVGKHDDFCTVILTDESKMPKCNPNTSKLAFTAGPLEWFRHGMFGLSKE